MGEFRVFTVEFKRGVVQQLLNKLSTAAAEQEGMFNICRGLTLAFRGPLHHTLKDHMTRPEALKFCGFVDTLLGVFTEAAKTSGKA